MQNSYLFILNGEKDAGINVIVFSIVTDYMNLCANMYVHEFLDWQKLSLVNRTDSVL